MLPKIIRRVLRLAIFAGIIVGGYFFGRVYLWPPEDRSKIQAVGMIEAPEVNITSRIAGRIKTLTLLEGDRVKKGQVVCLIEEGIRSRVFAPVDPRLATFAIQGSIRQLLLFYGPSRPVSELSRELGNLMLTALGANSTPNYKPMNAQ